MLNKFSLKNLALYFFIANILDSILTGYGINMGGLEVNPIMQRLIEHSTMLFAFVKIFIGFIVLYVAKYRSARYPKLEKSYKVLLLFGSILLTFAVINNIIVIFRLTT